MGACGWCEAMRRSFATRVPQLRRAYFYYVNHHAHLFSLPELEVAPSFDVNDTGGDALPSVVSRIALATHHEYPLPAGPTHLKDNRFLDFFFKRVKPTQQLFTSDEQQHLEFLELYPFVSLCAGEFNFLRCEDKPIVFHTLKPRDECEHGDKRVLLYGASLEVPFKLDLLRMCTNGRLYHPTMDENKGEYGLVASALAREMSAAL